MKKALFLSILSIFLFSGCFYPFSSEVDTPKKEIELPDDAPSWLVNSKKSGFITQVGATDNIDKKKFDFHKQKALINASHNFTKKLYSRIINLYKEYEEETEDNVAYDKDIKKFSEHISLKALTHARVLNTWVSKDNTLFIQIATDSDIVAEQIQNTSKLLFKVNRSLYQSFLSNRARKDIRLIIEE